MIALGTRAASSDAHQRPSWSSPVLVPVSMLTPEGTANLIVADGEVTRDGVNWVHARLAVLPDGRTGWLLRSALGGWSFVDTRVVVDRADLTLTLTLYRDGKVEFRTPVGVGKPGTPTPAGQFYVRDPDLLRQPRVRAAGLRQQRSLGV